MQVCVVAYGFESQLTVTYDKKQVGLTRIKELMQSFSVKKAKNKELARELSISRVEFDVKRRARMQAKELSDAQKLQIKFVAIKHFRTSANYDTELLEYAAVTYVECIGDMTKLMIKRAIEAVVLILVEVKKSYNPPTSPSQAT